MRKWIVASVTLLLLTNIVVLAGVAYNRSAPPVIIMDLTERELPLMNIVSGNNENSGTTLSLMWQIVNSDDVEYYSSTYGTPAWLDDKKLKALGFDMERFLSEPEKYRNRTSDLSREVFLVLEYDGDSFVTEMKMVQEKVWEIHQSLEEYPGDDKFVKELNRVEKRLNRLKTTQSRLYVVDAGLDQNSLIQKYTGKNNYLLARGEIGFSWDKNIIRGHVRKLFINQVHVPLPLSEQVVSLSEGDMYPDYNFPVQPRYSVRLNIGKRLEPWIESVEKINAEVDVNVLVN